MSYGVGHRCSSDLVLLWLWCRPAATAPIQPLPWEPLHATGVALKRQKKDSTWEKDPILWIVVYSAFYHSQQLSCYMLIYPQAMCIYIIYNIYTHTYIHTYMWLFRVTGVAYRCSQARGRIGAAAVSLYHSHSNARSKPCLQLTATPAPQPTERGRDGTCVLLDPSWVCYRWAKTGTPFFLIKLFFLNHSLL